MRWQSLLFDFDGTLADSALLHAKAFREALNAACPGKPVAFDYSRLKGLTTRAAFMHLGIVDSAALDACVAHKRTLYCEAVRAGRLTMYEDAPALLRASIESGGANYLVTSGSADSIDLALEVLGLKRFFVGVITADDAVAGKPAPDLYRVCLDRYGLKPGLSLAIEDAPAGVLSAQAAGLRVAGVHNPAVARIADYYFATLGELMIALRLSNPPRGSDRGLI